MSVIHISDIAPDKARNIQIICFLFLHKNICYEYLVEVPGPKVINFFMLNNSWHFHIY